MENLNAKDFFKGLISHSVDNGKLKVWSPNGVNVAQPYQKNSATKEMQAVLYMIESEDGQKFFVAISKDGQKCAISNDELMAYELYWNANRPVGYDGINLNPNTNLNNWKQPTTQVALGTIGFVTDKNYGSKYVTAATNGTKNLPEENFSKTLEEISKELQEHKESVLGMPGRKDSKESLIGTYQNSISNIDGLSNISKTIERAYEEKEIKENMGLKAKLTEELERIKVQIEKTKRDIETGNYTFKNSAEAKLAQAEGEKAEKIAEIQLHFGSSQSDDTEVR